MLLKYNVNIICKNPLEYYALNMFIIDPYSSVSFIYNNLFAESMLLWIYIFKSYYLYFLFF
jgi:hypothetical protein